MAGKTLMSGVEAAGHLGSPGRKQTEREMVLRSLYPFYLVQELSDEVIAPAFRVGLSTSVNSIWKRPPRHAQRHGVLDPSKFSI